jgi:hypothetical protein
MISSFNPYELSVTVRYTLAGIVMLVSLCVAIRSMEKEREEFLLKKPKRVYIDYFPWYWKIRIRILLLPRWGRVAVLVTTMAFYCCILLYFKLDETSMRQERKVLYGQIENAVRKKLGITEE